MKRNILFMLICTCMLLSGSTVLAGFTIWHLTRMSYYFWVTDLGPELASSLLMLTGGLLCFPVCWLMTLVPFHTRSLPIQSTLMFLSMSALIMLGVGITAVGGLSKAAQDTAALNSSMLHAMLVCSPVVPAVNKSFASMQIELNCCGVGSPYDYQKSNLPLPPSCCGQRNEKETCETPSVFQGCLRPAIFELHQFASGMTFLATTIIVLMAVTLFLYSHIVVTTEVTDIKKSQANPLRISCVTNPAPVYTFNPPPASNPQVYP